MPGFPLKGPAAIIAVVVIVIIILVGGYFLLNRPSGEPAADDTRTVETTTSGTTGSSATASGPEAAANAWVDLLRASKYDAAYDALASSAKTDVTKEKFTEQLAAVGSIASVSWGPPQYKDNKALLLGVLSLTNGQSLNIAALVVQENGAWRVHGLESANVTENEKE